MINKKIVIVIPAYGECIYLQEVLLAISQQTLKPDLVTIGHSGTQALIDVDKLPADFPILFRHSEERLLPGAARNYALANIECEVIAFLDADVKPQPDWLESLHQCYEKNTGNVLIGSIGYAVTGGYWGMVRWLIEFGSVHDYMPERELYNGPSANMMVNGKKFHDVGGFDITKRVGEDALLQDNLRQQGDSVMFCPKSKVLHFNLKGFVEAITHLYTLGKGGAKVRKEANLQGSIVIKYPILAVLLWLARLVMIMVRILRWGGLKNLWLSIFLPGAVIGLIAWNIGFIKGLNNNPDS